MPSFLDKLSAEYEWGRDVIRYPVGDPRKRPAWDNVYYTNSSLSEDHSTLAQLAGSMAGGTVGLAQMAGDGISDLYDWMTD